MCLGCEGTAISKATKSNNSNLNELIYVLQRLMIIKKSVVYMPESYFENMISVKIVKLCFINTISQAVYSCV